MSIGSNIARLRKDKGWTQAELGEKLGVSNQAVSKWESGMTMPDIMLLPEIAEVLQVSIEDLYKEINEQASISAKKQETFSEQAEEAKRKILCISVENKNGVAKTRVPVKAIQSLLNNKEVICGADVNMNELAMLNKMFDSNGTLVDVDKYNTKVKITVEDYEN